MALGSNAGYLDRKPCIDNGLGRFILALVNTSNATSLRRSNRRRCLSFLAVGLWAVAGWILPLLVGVAAAEQAEEEASTVASTLSAPPSRPVVRLRLESIVHPVVADFLVQALREADEMGAEVVVVELDTPGGLASSMHEMTTAIQEAATPVVVYVAPAGARAASAGFFVLMAADIAVMAPATNTGAAATIDLGGEDLRETLQQKVEEDSRAAIRAMAQRRGRNVDLAQLAVTESKAFSASEALEGGLIDFIANDFEDLLAQLEGREVEKVEGREPRRLAVVGAPRRDLEMTQVQRLLAVLIGPNIALALLSFGGIALLIELYNPGSILPGVVGAICLILGAFGVSMLPVNYAGLALIALAMILFVAEIKVVSYGLLTVGGVISLVLGGLILFRTSEPALRVSVGTLASVAIFALLAAGGLAYLALSASRRQVATGAEGLLHRRARARTALAPRGKVFVHGELWEAVSEVPVEVDTEVEIVAVDRLTLRVRPLQGSEPEHHS